MDTLCIHKEKVGDIVAVDDFIIVNDTLPESLKNAV